jgi:PadR family transcriptional regulator, regulatory protein PadR
MTDIDLKGTRRAAAVSLLDARARHGYELSKLIESPSEGKLVFHIDSLYPLRYRLEGRSWSKGSWEIPRGATPPVLPPNR